MSNSRHILLVFFIFFTGKFSALCAATNTKAGKQALQSISSGSKNTALGNAALSKIKTSSSNTAIGYQALTKQTGGNGNIAVGSSAGSACTTGSNNIYIGNSGTANENGYIRIGTKNVHKECLIPCSLTIEGGAELTGELTINGGSLSCSHDIAA